MNVAVVVCLICGAQKKELNGHLRMHGLTANEYKEKFPGASIISKESAQKKSSSVRQSHMTNPRGEVSEEVRKKISQKSKEMHSRLKSEDIDAYLRKQQANAKKAREAKGLDYKHSEETKEKMRGPRPNMVGRFISPETRSKISIAKSNHTGWEHSEETKEKMRQAWKDRKNDIETYSKYTESVSQRMKQPANVARLRTQVAKNISNGNHNGKSKDTVLEKRFIAFLQTRNIVFTHQYAIHTDKGSWLYDFFLPELNMLVEVDGEYWHRKPEAFNRDKIKNKLAATSGFRFVRISDKRWNPELIFETDATISKFITDLMTERGLKLHEAKPPNQG